MRKAQNRSAWLELWRPSASSGMNGRDDDDDDDDDDIFENPSIALIHHSIKFLLHQYLW